MLEFDTDLTWLTFIDSLDLTGSSIKHGLSILRIGVLQALGQKHESTDNTDDESLKERKMQPARGRFARSDLDRQMASTFPCPLESGPSSRFLGQPATGTRRVAGTTHTESGRR